MFRFVLSSLCFSYFELNSSQEAPHSLDLAQFYGGMASGRPRRILNTFAGIDFQLMLRDAIYTKPISSFILRIYHK